MAEKTQLLSHSRFQPNNCFAGVCMGLAWTSHGGSTLYIETLKQQRRKTSKEDELGNGKIEFTGGTSMSFLMALFFYLSNLKMKHQ